LKPRVQFPVLKKRKELLDIVMHVYILATQEAELKVSLGYTVSSRIAWAI
jgi:hypothetical protein